MVRPGRSILGLALAAVLAASVGCQGTERIPSSPKSRASKAPGARVGSPAPEPLPTMGTAANPRLVERTPRPAKTPTVTTVAAKLPAFPDVAVQPVALNPTDSIGLAEDTQNFVVVSAAIKETVRQASIAVDEAGGRAYHVDPTYGLTAADGPAAPADAHMRFRAWQRDQLPADLDARRPAYGLQQAANPLARGAKLSFWVITTFEGETSQEVQISAKVQEVGTHCYVVIDDKVMADAKQATALAAKAKTIATVFDDEIYPTDTRLFGSEPNPGVDRDPRLFILLTPAVGNYGADTTLGYFSQRDEFVPRPDDPPVFQHSNAKEMLYISSKIVLSGSPDDYLGTIAHEFQHMINFNQKVLVAKNKASDDLWIDEGMAMYAIETCGYGLRAGGDVLANHVKRYLGEPEAFSLTEWEDNPEGIGYGPVYLFMVYLADRFSEGIIKEIVTSPKIGPANVDEVLAKRGVTLARVFHDWSMANLLDGRKQVDNPIHGYASLVLDGANGATTLGGLDTARLDLPGVKSFPLRPFSARYFRMPDGFLTPQFTIDVGQGVKAGTVTRLVLPQEDF